VIAWKYLYRDLISKIRGGTHRGKVKSANSNPGTTGLLYSVSSGITKAESGEETIAAN